MRNGRRFIGDITNVIRDNQKRRRKKSLKRRDTWMIILFLWSSNDTRSRLITESAKALQSHCQDSQRNKTVRFWPKGRSHLHRWSIRSAENELYATPQRKLNRRTVNRQSCSKPFPIIRTFTLGKVQNIEREYHPIKCVMEKETL